MLVTRKRRRRKTDAVHNNQIDNGGADNGDDSDDGDGSDCDSGDDESNDNMIKLLFYPLPLNSYVGCT